MGLSLARVLILPEKKIMSLARFTVLIFWFTLCTFPCPCHYQLNATTLNATTYSNIEIGLRVKRSERRSFILILDWIILWAICIRRMKLSPYSRNENKIFQSIMSKASSESTETAASVLSSVFEGTIVSQGNCVLYGSSLCFNSLSTANFWI